VVAGTEAGAVLADAATGCGGAFDGCGSDCPGGEAGLDGAADSGVCAVAGDEDGFADCWAFALNVSNNEEVITQSATLAASNRTAAMLFIRNLLIFQASGTSQECWPERKVSGWRHISA